MTAWGDAAAPFGQRVGLALLVASPLWALAAALWRANCAEPAGVEDRVAYYACVAAFVLVGLGIVDLVFRP